MTCQKIRYHTKKQVRLEIQRIKDNNHKAGIDNIDLHFYLCPECRYYHITSNGKHKRLMESDQDYPDKVKMSKIIAKENGIHIYDPYKNFRKMNKKGRKIR